MKNPRSPWRSRRHGGPISEAITRPMPLPRSVRLRTTRGANNIALTIAPTYRETSAPTARFVDRRDQFPSPEPPWSRPKPRK